MTRPRAFFPIALGAVAVACVVAIPAADSPAAALKRGVAQFEAKNYTGAIGTLRAMNAPPLADYRAWYLANALSAAKDLPAVPETLEPVFTQVPESPFRSDAALLSAQALRETGKAAEAVALLKELYGELSQPLGDFGMAESLNAAGDGIAAAVYYQRVYYGYPSTTAAKLSAEQMATLKESLGGRYPPPLPHAMLARAAKLLSEGKYAAAREEYESLVPVLGGEERDLARVRIGAAHYLQEKNQAAYTYLSSLEVSGGEADAERLNYLSQSARRLGKLGEMDTYARLAAERYPHSPATNEALIAAGNRHLLDNDVSAYEALYRACAEGMPGDPRADLCHWKITWAEYMRRGSKAADMLREHLRMYPNSEQSSAALYYLGRLAPAPDARAYFEEVVNEYPNHFYASQARERLAKLGKTEPAAGARQFLKEIAFGQRSRWPEFENTAAGRARIERASLLAEAGLTDLAERELRYGANKGDQPHVLAMELSALKAASDPAQAMRYIKAYARGYLYIPLQAAPSRFWEMAFPLPYRADLEKSAKQYNVDPFLLAGLIRQESEFDAKAVSRTGARGLTQIQPTTGRELGKRLKLGYTVAKLFQPSYNLQLGAYHLNSMMKQAGGKEEVALAAYNAGFSRAKAWIQWGEFREPAEFIETVPFTETRGYIQAVLRNAATYREVYGANPPIAAE